MSNNPFDLTKLAKLFEMGQIEKKINWPDPLQQPMRIAEDITKRYNFNDVFDHKTIERKLTATEVRMQQEKKLAERKHRAIEREYNASRIKLLNTIKDMLKEFEGYQLLLQSDSYKQLQQMVEQIESAGDNVDKTSAIEDAYLNALCYGIGQLKL